MNKATTVLILLSIIYSSCSKKNKGNRPDLPQADEFEINFDNFQSPPSTNDNNYSNYLHAYQTVQPWIEARKNELRLPLAILYASGQAKAGYRGDNKGWLFKYEYEENGRTYKVKLYAEYQNSFSQISWKMYVTQKEGFKDFLWMEGTTHADRSQGVWTVYYSHDNHRPLMQISQHYNFSTKKRKITYRFLSDLKMKADSYLEWGYEYSPPYDFFYNIFDNAKNNHISIQWSSLDGSGNILDPLYFMNNNRQCWANNRKNTNCS